METFWRFDALDCLFFRDGRPFNRGESVWIDSVFPPTGFTVQGAFRSALLASLDADFAEFAKGNPCLPDGTSLKSAMGDAESLGGLSLVGPFLMKGRELLFPAPLNLVADKTRYTLLRPGAEPCLCDLGMVRLPTAEGHGWKALSETYVTIDVINDVLSGRTDSLNPGTGHTASSSANRWSLYPEYPDSPGLVDREPKIGLARDNQTRLAQEGMLYSIAPVRPRPDVSIVVGVRGLDAEYIPGVPLLARLGGEGKLAAMHTISDIEWPQMPRPQSFSGDRLRYTLVLTMPARVPTDGWLPSGFRPRVRDGVTVWSGNSLGFEVDIVSACIGKPRRIGGWDIANNCPRPLTPFVPPGSVYYCESSRESEEEIAALHLSMIGEKTEYGFGHVLVGAW